MNRAVHHRTFNADAVHEGGATLISLLAYPDDNSDSQRANLHASLCAYAIRKRFGNSPERHLFHPLKPIHALREHDKIAKDFKTLGRRLRDRMVAAKMALPFLQQATGSMPSKLPNGITRLSINQMAKFVLEDSGQTDPNNVKNRIWAESIPVIHLASATAVMTDALEKAGCGQPHFDDLLSLRPLVEAIVREAQIYEGLIKQSPKLKGASERLIRVRLSST